MVILFDASAPVKPRKAFAVGLAREPRHEWATDSEYRERFLASTLSPAEFDARLERQAGESAATDAHCRGLVFA